MSPDPPRSSRKSPPGTTGVIGGASPRESCSHLQFAFVHLPTVPFQKLAPLRLTVVAVRDGRDSPTSQRLVDAFELPAELIEGQVAQVVGDGPRENLGTLPNQVQRLGSCVPADSVAVLVCVVDPNADSLRLNQRKGGRGDSYYALGSGVAYLTHSVRMAWRMRNGCVTHN